jgi:tetratricopeptide (TPR) repeat protein
MNAMRNTLSGAAFLLLMGLSARAQAPLAKPLAEFDKLVEQLKAGSTVGEAIRIGDTTVIPFAKIKFGLGGGGAMIGFGGGMGGKIVPLGILIVEGDDVRAELFPEPEEKPTLLQELVRRLMDRKIVLGNGLNIGGTAGTPQDMAPLITEMLGKTTIIGNALNLGSLKAPASTAASAKNASLDELKKLFEAKKYDDALAMADTLIAQDPKNADGHVWKGRIMGSLAQGNPANMIKYGMGAMQEFEKVLALDPNNPDAHFGRGMGRMMAPPGFGGDADGAIADFEASIAKKPSPEAYFQLGEALKKKGSNDKAAAAYKKALELRPNFPEAAKALADLK